MATVEKDLIQENEKLTARLKKAVEVFNEQKATITRQSEEIAALKAKAAEAESKDSEFFDQVNEIEKLKDELANVKKELETKENEHAAQVNTFENKIKDLTDEYNEVVRRSNKMVDTFRKIQKLTNDELND